jgi:hypothetical protein
VYEEARSNFRSRAAVSAIDPALLGDAAVADAARVGVSTAVGATDDWAAPHPARVKPKTQPARWIRGTELRDGTESHHILNTEMEDHWRRVRRGSVL